MTGLSLIHSKEILLLETLTRNGILKLLGDRKRRHRSGSKGCTVMG